MKYKFRKKLPWKKQRTLEVGVLVAIAYDLDDLILILRGKGLLAVINNNEAETDGTFLEAEGKGNEEKSALFNLKDTAILYDLLNSLWLLQMSLETSIEFNIDLANFRFPFSTWCNLSEL